MSASCRLSKASLICLVTVLGFVSGSALAQDAEVPLPETAPTDATEVGPENESLPPIEAKAYDLRVVRPSKSGNVYLFVKQTDGSPDIGRIFLLKKDAQTPVMGFRVLRIYPGENQVAAKKVREYSGFPELAPGDSYRAYEKVGDVGPIPNNTAEDLKDLSEIEKAEELQTPPAASTEDQVPAPIEGATEEPPAPAQPDEGATEELPVPAQPDQAEKDESAPSPAPPAAEDEELKSLEVNPSEFNETAYYDYFPSWLTLEGGLIRHGRLPGSAYQKGFGVLYARNIKQNLFRHSTDYPDGLSLEGGFYTFRSNGVVDGVTKSFTMLPIKGQLRYTVPTSETLSLYLYGGLIYHHVANHVNATNADLAAVMILRPALGVGGLIQFGPNWFIRLNLGLDTLSAGVVLRF